MLDSLFLLAWVVSAVALLYARWEYRKRGKLTLFGLFLLCCMLLVPNLMLDYATSYRWPSTALNYFGVLLGLAGLALCFISIARFNSIAKMLCLDTGQLTVTGLYRWSRNPQYVGWFLFLLGFALTDWSPWCAAALLVVAVSLHLLVLIEEEHLLRVFGDSYRDFCRQVPRYLRWGQLRI
jgi:protein-S-isoprenylcysteine O-methyltransferase Ste14